MWYLIFIDSRGRDFRVQYSYFLDYKKNDVLKRIIEKLEKRRNILDTKELYCNCYIIFCCVFTEKPSITTHPEGDTVTEGDYVTLSCNATGNPAPNISWTRKGSPLNAGGRISFSDGEKQLTITNVHRTDSGEYQCVATNRVGKDASNAATLNVQCKTNIMWRDFKIKMFLSTRV